MCSGFVPASQLYDVDSRTPIAHPAHQATDEDVRRALGDREIRADGGCNQSSSGTYRIGDAIAELRLLESESAAVVCLDDAWARPGRQGAFGVEYDTHDFEATTEIVDVAWEVLEVGGWLIADADDWLAPRLEAYIREEYGDVSAWYEGGGYRRRGGITYVDASGDPDTSTPGQYLSNGGYPVIFAHKGSTSRRTTTSARQVVRHPRRVEDGYPYGWGSVKLIEPYRRWIEGVTDINETVVVPCAGTAPAAIAAEDLRRRWIAIDSEPDAREAFRQRREAYLEGDEQTTLVDVVADGGNDCTLHTKAEQSYSQSENSTRNGGGSQ